MDGPTHRPLEWAPNKANSPPGMTILLRSGFLLLVVCMCVRLHVCVWHHYAKTLSGGPKQEF